MQNTWSKHRVLIWGKTYPELSSKYFETVCTGGTLEADGRFVRLYPIPFRYLSDDNMFTKYQWVRVRLIKAKDDPRPESYKIDPANITLEEKIETDKKGWKRRKEKLFRNSDYIFDNVEQLIEKNKENRISLGFTLPKVIDEIKIEQRDESEYHDFIRKMKAIEERTKQPSLFPDLSINEIKKLEYVSQRFRVYWHCYGKNCNGHGMQILDWEAYELSRKIGVEKALSKIESVLNLSEYDTGFFLGNFRRYHNTFGIGAIWYPKTPVKSQTIDLFER